MKAGDINKLINIYDEGVIYREMDEHFMWMSDLENDPFIVEITDIDLNIFNLLTKNKYISLDTNMILTIVEKVSKYYGDPYS